MWKSAHREADDNNYCDKNTSIHVLLRMRKFYKKIHFCCRDSFFVKKDIQRDAPFGAVFEVTTLAVLFLPYPREKKANTAKCKSAAILLLPFFYGNGAAHSHVGSIACTWLKHAHSFDRCGDAIDI